MQYRLPKTALLEEVDLVAGQHNDAEASAAARESMQRLYHALETLDPKERLAVVMHDVDGCTLKEISRALGRPLQTIASQLHAGRARIAAHLQGDVLWQSPVSKEVEAP